MKPKVSVCVVTFNHEKYIAECLDSILAQETDFDFEIIVGDDASTDGTRCILETYQKRYRNKIKAILRDVNVGVVNNLADIYNQANGEYIAHIDGDDVMLPGKLKKQSLILDENENCVICSHDMKVIDASGNVISKSFRKHRKKVNSLLDLYRKLPFFAHSSKMFRNNLSNGLFDFLKKCDHRLDHEVHVFQAKEGDIYHLNLPLGCYRVNTGVSFSGNEINKIFPRATKRVFEDALIEKRYKESLLKKLYSKNMLAFAYQSILIGNKKDLEKYVVLSISIKLFSITQLLFLVLAKCFPSLLVTICRLRASIKKKL